MFDGFVMERRRVGDVELRVRIGGSGRPLLLLHGHPQTHAMWHLVAPSLAERHTVVVPDLPGYGESTPIGSGSIDGSKRAMARVMVALMASLGHQRFDLAGHDRGGRVGYRLALDDPERIRRLAVLDIVPTAEMWRRMNTSLAMANWHWLFLAQAAPMPERLLSADPEAYYYRDRRERFHPEALADYLAACRRPEVIHAMCQDYRAGATLDRQLDEADAAAGRRIAAPLLALWSAEGEIANWDPIQVWRAWAEDVTGRELACGHYLAEEAPDVVIAELRRFLG
ncbi:MAG TPA: alpha/beta hydrolase [Candidatus Limnocylindria bacterium]|nr:alpha/beta hydrolase [Candidatus Limnocylindria bacterium]